MVSSGQVSTDSNSFSSTMTSYDNVIGELGTSWKGNSYNNLEAKVKEFLVDFSSKIQTQMNDFTRACQLYESYLVVKQNYQIAQENYNIALSNEDGGASATYSAQMAEYLSKMEEIKTNIINLLSSISAVNLEANSGVSI